MKKSQSELLQKHLKDFLDANNLYLHKSGPESVDIHVRKPDENIKTSKFDETLSILINKCPYAYMGKVEQFWNFCVYLKDKVDDTLLVDFLCKKEPNASHASSISAYHSRSTGLLKDNPDALFSFVARKKFLQHRATELDQSYPFSILQSLQNTEQAAILLEMIVHIPSIMSNIDYQTKVYATMRKFITDIDKYSEFFPNILIVEENQDLFEQPQSWEKLYIPLNLNKINSYNLNKRYGTTQIMRMMESIQKTLLQHIDVLNIKAINVNLVSDMSMGELSFEFEGHNLQKKILTDTLNNMLKKILSYNDINTFNQCSKLDLFAEAYTKAQADILREMLPEQQIKAPRRKI